MKESVTLEEEKKISENIYRNIIQTSTDGFLVVSAEGHILDVNDVYATMSGYSKAELLTMRIPQLEANETEDDTASHIKNIIESGWDRFESAHRRRDGSTLKVEISTTFIPELNKFVAFIRDITKRKERFEQLQTILDSLDCLVYVADLNSYELLFVNKYGRDIFGDIKGKICWKSLQSGQNGPCAFCTNEKLLDVEGNPVGPIVWEFQNTLNNEWYECRDQVIEWLDGQLVRMEIATNITQRKKAENNRKKIEEQLRQSHKMEALGTLAGGIAHDFNNLLNAIIVNSDLLLRDIPEKNTAYQNASEIKKAGKQASKLVRQILAFSRRTEQKRQPVQLQNIIKDVLKLLRSTLPTTIEIHQAIDTNCSAVIADKIQVHQVVMNLFTNASHAMLNEKGLLVIKLQEVDVDHNLSLLVEDLSQGKYVQLTVSDTGYGMDRETMERIFEPYFTTKNKVEGTGLGMATVHGIVKNHGGAISIKSELGKGTTVSIFFPVADTPVALSQPKEQKKELPKINARVLFVDDVEFNVQIGTHVCEHLGCQATGFTSSVEALASFRQAPDRFDIVITDQTMPELTGFDLAQELFKIRPDIPVIMVTGHSHTVDEKKAKEAGIKDFLMKPLDIDILAESITKVLF